jgi:hypothetical protein
LLLLLLLLCCHCYHYCQSYDSMAQHCVLLAQPAVDSYSAVPFRFWQLQHQMCSSHALQHQMLHVAAVLLQHHLSLKPLLLLTALMLRALL